MSSFDLLLQELFNFIDAVDHNKTKLDKDATKQTLHSLIEELRIQQTELRAQTEELLNKEHNLQRAKQKYFDLFHTAPVGYLNLDRKGVILEINQIAATILGAPVSNWHNRPLVTAIIPGAHTSFYQYLTIVGKEAYRIKNEFQIKTVLNQQPRYISCETIALQKEPEVSYHMVITDITEQKELEAQLIQLAKYDTLTTLPNRHSLYEFVEQSLNDAEITRQKVAVLLCDLDGFKHINDHYGHFAGDHILNAVGERFQQLISPTDILARFGGDEFVFVLTNIDTVEELHHFAERIFLDLQNPFKLPDLDHDILINISIGISIFPDTGLNLKDLLKQADLAMYHAKRRQMQNYQIFTTSLQQKAADYADITRELQTTLRNGTFQLKYQPLVNIKTREVNTVEALIRWSQEDGSFISPDIFIPYAEESGLIIPLTYWVVENAALELKTHLSGLDEHIRVSLNISGHELIKEDFYQKFCNTILEHQLPLSQFDLEITERVLVPANLQVLTTLNQFREAGMRLILDDFGAGYSSLNHLLTFPVDRIKIDGSLIKAINVDENKMALIRAIIKLAQTFGLEVVAEGVETKEQLLFLHQYGCDFIQGYLFSRPVDIEYIPSIIKEIPNKINQLLD